MPEYYASPTGGGNGLSADSRCTMAEMIALLDAGDTGHLASGTYTGNAGMLIANGANSGTAQALIIVSADEDGGPLIDGQGARQPILLSFVDYWLVLGLNARNSISSVVQILDSNYCQIRRTIGWDAADGNHQIFGAHASSGTCEHNLLEDCAGWGVCRKVYSNSQGGNYITRRRCFARWEASHVIGAKTAFEFGYNSIWALDENCIGTWDSSTGKMNAEAGYVLLGYDGLPWEGPEGGTYHAVQYPKGVFSASTNAVGAAHHARTLGCIAFVTANQKCEIGNLNGLFHNYRCTETLYQDCAAHTPQSIRPWRLDGSDLEPPAGLAISNCTGIGPLASVVKTPDWSLSDLRMVTVGTGLTLPVDGKGATIRKRYVDGVLTGDNLWPWPMATRMHDAMILGGYDPTGIDAFLAMLAAEVIGENSGAPIAPEEGEVMVYCTRSDIEAVFGKINLVKWADLDNLGNQTDIAIRINAAIVWASNEVDSRLRKYIYALPLANEDHEIPLEIVDIAANLAGVWLYENRGVQDFDPETGRAVHRLEWNRKRAEATLRQILAGVRTLDAAIRVANTSPVGVNDV